MRLDRSALLPIDFQRAFDLSWPRRWNGELDNNGQALLAAWRKAGRTLIHVRHDSVEPESTLRPGQPHAFRPGFEPQAGEPVIAKSVNAAFIGTDLDLRLRRLAIDTLVVFHISTDMCVSTTVRVGANLGYRMVLVEDACDCFDLPDDAGRVIRAEDGQAAHVATLRFEFAEVMRTQQVLDLLAELDRRNRACA